MNFLPNKIISKSLLAISACILISCTNESSDEEPTTQDLKENLSITQGVYGLTTSHNDVGDNPIEIISGFDVDIFYEQPTTDLEEDVTPLVSIKSNGEGLYEEELESGEYCICTSFRRCAPVVIHENELLRLDYESSVGPGWSLPNDLESTLALSCE